MHNIICFETEWLYNSHKGNQFNLETKLLLDCLRNFYKCDIIHRHILYREDLQYYMDYFTTKRKFDKYDIMHVMEGIILYHLKERMMGLI